jgi:murein DD-endopeptidase MepM/ murein hydrolase activator NlpD/predicted small secreted protein
MSNRVTGRAFRTAAIVSVLVGATALSGCSSLAGLGFDRTTTSSVNSSAPLVSNQSMPRTLSAESRFVPPGNIGGGGPGSAIGATANISSGQPLGSVSTEDLPVLTSSANGSNQMMPAAQPLSPVPATTNLASVPASNSLVSVPSDAYVHVIESGESLYTVARRYNVTAQAIISANGFSSPDKIYVGQKIVIPGKASQLAAMGPKPSASQPAQILAPAVQPVQQPAQVASLGNAPAAGTPEATVKPLTAPTAAPAAVASVAPAKPLQQPASEPVLSGAEKFRWPVSGRVITDFANSKGTGINIEAPEGTAVRAAENGQVIYAGSGVEGYGNLILIRHPNGYVSAYAHLKDMNVAKGTVVNRGDNIGTTGKTGSVSKAQLHFELRKGATPVDPIPLLAS